MYIRSPEGQRYPRLHQKKHGQRVEGGDSAPLVHSHETLHPRGPQYKKDMDLLEQSGGGPQK